MLLLDELHNHFSEDVLNRDFIVETIHDYLGSKKDLADKNKVDIDRLSYLLEKQKVCPLDKEELYELYELLN